MIVIPAPPGSQVASYDADEDGGRQLVWRSICAVILSDQLANAGQLTHAVPTAGGPICGNRPGYRMGALGRDHPMNDPPPFFTLAR